MAGFMDWEFAEVMLQGYPGGGYCEDVPADNTPTPDGQPTPDDAAQRVLRIAYVAGVTPGKWIRRWEERMPDIPLEAFMVDDGVQRDVLDDGRAHMAFVRLPIEREGLSVIPLYEEQPVVVAPKGHEISVFEEVALADLAQESFLDPATLGGPDPALQVVASGAGLVILPMSVARHFNVKDTVARRLTGAGGTEIALAWPAEATDEVLEEFIGVVRGRTAQSSRQPSAQPQKVKKEPKPDRRGTGTKKAPKVAQRYAPNPDKGRGKGSRKKGKR
ncbi:LysR family substrate-binding domain-containing protein [Pseudarthrobacter sp. NIBRBAC000502770]|uniref:LysR family substrate-binding domain-containing protein n=1 Tax=Pseudarthrobacter sp. NIBRBAC000502770 TaxID=2590785 RepID=UPI001FF07C94|nr:LysR family substrate-binding domain-containing protein [Pseudarthrobacter sp. NIBRBAC000502770]